MTSTTKQMRPNGRGTFRGKTYSDPSYIFSEGQDPQPPGSTPRELISWPSCPCGRPSDKDYTQLACDDKQYSGDEREDLLASIVMRDDGDDFADQKDHETDEWKQYTSPQRD